MRTFLQKLFWGRVLFSCSYIQFGVRVSAIWFTNQEIHWFFHLKVQCYLKALFWTFEAAFEKHASMWYQTFRQKSIKRAPQVTGYHWIPGFYAAWSQTRILWEDMAAMSSWLWFIVQAKRRLRNCYKAYAEKKTDSDMYENKQLCKKRNLGSRP